jgi:hypothetical protein
VRELRWKRYPLVADAPLARSWLQIQSDLGLAPNTIEAHGHTLQDYPSFSRRAAAMPETARRSHIAAYVRDLTTGPASVYPA